MTNEEVVLIKKDRLRYSKNKLSSNLTLLAIILNAMYFVSIYKSDVGTYYYTYMIGISIVYNLLFMLIAFLSSEGVKNYKIGYSFVLMALGAGQLFRITIIPMNAKDATITLGEESRIVMLDKQFYYVVGCLIVSAALCIIAGIVGVVKTKTLTSYQEELDNKAKGAS
ncbi:MAG: hypothetical protein K2J77_04665 [Oscillospiraceae bacterium]|nr:hypothetical protein [Oscillospiraceae bacterium]